MDPRPPMPDLPAYPASPPAPWRILVVDDEPEVLEMTRLVLGRYRYQDRPLDIGTARSATEAREYLDAHPNTALMLLDVVMEDDHAGLALVRHVRDTLGDSRLQILLRTGQPGAAPEADVIQHYEINGYYLKTELTAQRLNSIVTLALRSYQAMQAAPASAYHPAPHDLPAWMAGRTSTLATLRAQAQVHLSSGVPVGVAILPTWQPSLPLLHALPPALRTQLDLALLSRVCEWTGQLGARRPPAWRVSVPLLSSPAQADALLPTLARLLSQAGVSGAALDLQLYDEPTAHDEALAAQTCRQLKAWDISVTLADVGASAVSLARLWRLGPDRVALPRPFVQGVATDLHKTALVRALIALTHTLDLTAVAHGIDTPADAQFFKWEGCDVGQGDALTPALSLDDTAEHLRRLSLH